MNNTYENMILELAGQVRFNKIDEDWSDFYETKSIDKKQIQFPNYTEEDIIKRLGRKKRWNLTLLKPFVDILKYKTQTKQVSVLTLSCTSRFWRLIYKQPRYVSRLFALAQDVGLLTCVDDKYQFNAYHKEDNKAKAYAWNKDIEHMLLSLFKSFNISINNNHVINHSYLISIVDTFANDDSRKKEYEEAERRFNIRIAQKTCLPLNDDIIHKGLIEKYPQLLELWKTIDEDNATKPLDEYDYAVPKIKRDINGNATKISFRMTNQYCPAKVHSISDEDYESGRMIRDDIIKEKFGAVYENDVKSSIYRITYLLNHGVWLDSSIDLYEEIYGAKFKSKDDRDLFKHPFCMQLYFNKSSKQMKAHIEYKKSATKEWNKENGGLELIMKAQDNMVKAIGKSYESEIFLHESCIYAQVAHKLRTMGYKVIQIYDGFFTDKDLGKETFDNIVKEQALSYYHKYINNHNHNNNNHNNHNNHISNINSGHIRNIDSRKTNTMKRTLAFDNSDIPSDEEILAQKKKSLSYRLQEFHQKGYLQASEAERLRRHSIYADELPKIKDCGTVFEDTHKHLSERQIILNNIKKNPSEWDVDFADQKNELGRWFHSTSKAIQASNRLT